jgi:hypothetical protein
MRLGTGRREPGQWDRWGSTVEAITTARARSPVWGGQCGLTPLIPRLRFLHRVRPVRLDLGAGVAAPTAGEPLPYPPMRSVGSGRCGARRQRQDQEDEKHPKTMRGSRPGEHQRGSPKTRSVHSMAPRGLPPRDAPGLPHSLALPACVQVYGSWIRTILTFTLGPAQTTHANQLPGWFKRLLRPSMASASRRFAIKLGGLSVLAAALAAGTGLLIRVVLWLCGPTSSGQ